MAGIPFRTALVVGAGDGISGCLAKALTDRGIAVGIAAHNINKLEALSAETGAMLFKCDASRSD
ncbi:hypothetical protein ACI2JN_02465 [Ochrobactrum teleogrylli]|uniref:hypothetical protein n=1 Tax=Ochrobactrum teleogrylli TaxID=2479765 RepID=UPI0038509C76